MLLYMALAPESKLSAPHCGSNASPCTPFPPLAYARPLARAAYKEGGPAAEARFEAGVAGFEARAFRGCGVFTSGASAPARCHRLSTTTTTTTARRRSPLPLAPCAQSRLRSRTVRKLAT